MDAGTEWVRSPRCESGNCVELTWVKSPTSGADGCVEAAWVGRKPDGFLGDGAIQVAATELGHVHMRDSKDPDGPVLVFTWREWRAFHEGIGAISRALDASLASSVPSER